MPRQVATRAPRIRGAAALANSDLKSSGRYYAGNVRIRLLSVMVEISRPTER